VVPSPPPDELTDLIHSDPTDAPSGLTPGHQLTGPKIDPRVTDRPHRELEALGYGETN